MMEYQVIALVLFGLGAILLLGEILIPTGGYLVVGGLLFFATGVGTILIWGQSTYEAVVAITALAIGLPAAGFAAVAAWRRLSLDRTLDSGIADACATAMPQIAGLGALKGRVGKTVSTMRPSGTVEFDGRRVDAMTEGMMIDAGVWVRCVDVKGGKVVVRQMDSPTDITDINLDDPKPGADRHDDLDLDLGK